MNKDLYISPTWGPFKSENEFNEWLMHDGEKYLKRELRTFFQSDFSRIPIINPIFGYPDHVFYSIQERKLMLIECCNCDSLKKRHISKDFLYTIEEYPNFDIDSKSLLWISNSAPSKEIVKILEKIHLQVIVGTGRIDFHVAIPVPITLSSLRLNIIHSFGTRLLDANRNNFMVDFINSTAWLTQKQTAEFLHIPRSTMSNICKRWKLCDGSNKISTVKIRGFIESIEKKATLERGNSFSGKFIPVFQKTANMLYPEEVNTLLGNRGYIVRIAELQPKWITIVGPSNTGYRCLFDKKDVLDYKKNQVG